MSLEIRDITNVIAGRQTDERMSRNREYDGHEQVVYLEDTAIRFRGLIAIHNTARGEALGGCRYRMDYESIDDAVTDVLRLSRGMTYKNAMAGLDLGGGKAVIIGAKGQSRPRPEEIDALAHGVRSLGGRYVTAEDMNTSEENMLRIWGITRHVSGIPLAKVAASRFPSDFDHSELPGANPSPYTAHGTLAGIKAAVRYALNKDDLRGVRVAVKGAAGAVGATLCDLLYHEGVRLIVSDWDGNEAAQANLRRVAGRVDAQIVSSSDIMFADADVFAPCARGSDINDQTIDRLRAKIVAGCANNVLAEQRHAQALYDRGILYAPDYVINAGGVICAGMQHLWLAHEGKYAIPTHRAVMEKTLVIRQTLGEIFQTADARQTNTAFVADSIARTLFERPAAMSVKTTEVQEAVAA